MTFELGPMQEKWLAALESGEYEQCHEQLCKVDPEGLGQSFCCLGVANHLFGFGIDNGEGNLAQDDAYREVGMHDGSGTFINVDGECVSLMLGGGSHGDLTSANDSGATFAEIAAFIRANPEVVFKEPK